MTLEQNTLSDDTLTNHPVCPTCGVPMWLTKIMSDPSGDRLHDRYYFECKVCDSLAVLQSLNH
jgi:hypothetical protein